MTRKRIWYFFVKYYMRIGFIFYFKNIRIEGADHIPDNKAIMFVANHQNALLDPLLIGSTNKRTLHFLTQAQVFKNAFVKRILVYINMLPVYRIRDGYHTLSKNDDTFKQCYDILDNKETLLIFAEGSHSLKRRVRELSKGFTRIVFGALEHNPDNNIDIIPVGYNYSNAKKYGSKVSIYYGQPISANKYWNKSDPIESANELKQEVREQLKKLTTHIDDQNNYDQIVIQFKNDDFLFPDQVNTRLKQLNLTDPSVSISKRKYSNPLKLIVYINSVFPMLIWKKVYPSIKEEEYIATFRFIIGVLVFPIFYLIQMGIITYFFGINFGFLYLILSVLSVFLLAKTNDPNQ